jgi:hypothetical protein
MMETTGTLGERASSSTRHLLGLGMAVAGLLALSRPAAGSPSGLNNTPTADTCPVKTVVIQGWSGFAHDTDPDWWTGVKFGVIKGLELGADWDADGDPSRHVQFQGKYGIDLNDWGTRLAVGMANVSDDEDRNGEEFPYAVLTQVVKGWFRVHAGYDVQEDNQGAFAGVDTTVCLLSRDVTFCADVIQTNDRDDALYAPGIKFGLGKKLAEEAAGVDAILQHFVFETWANFSTASGSHEPAGYVAKLNFVLGF